LIFTPKYRRDVFTDDEVRRMCLESFAETCYALGVRMEACEFGPDHVHLFVSRCKNYSVPYLVQRFKGASSHRIKQELWERVRGKLWGDSFWSDGYFYRSVGSTLSNSPQYSM
jgi:REP element-mobilizing transposase RayT